MKRLLVLTGIFILGAFWSTYTFPADLSGGKSAQAPGESFDVFIQDQTTENISLFVGNPLDAGVTLNANTTNNQQTIEASFPSTAPTNGNFLCIKEGVHFTQMEIVSVAALGGDDYSCTLSIPLDHAFSTNSHVCLQNVNMAVDGSSTEVMFFVSPTNLDSTVAWDVTRIIVAMTHSASGDDGKFGGISALTEGVYFRVDNGNNQNLFNIKENADLAIEGYDVAYATRSGGGGTYGTRSRITFSGQDKRGVTMRLYASDGGKFRVAIRDDLTGLDSFRVKVQGHVVD